MEEVPPHANEIAVQAWSGRTNLPAYAVVQHLLAASDVAAANVRSGAG